ncbi:MAG: membrane protein insertion efficiency factor YidD [bacterium]|nr:membrane protein insertion efficiency factor YidD [bacterium]
MRTAKTLFLFCIFVYQKTVSPDHGIFFSARGGSAFGGYSLRRCRFSPSCSEYSSEALRQYGLLKGSVLSLARIFRCGPWSRGGYDPVRQNSKFQAPNYK